MQVYCHLEMHYKVEALELFYNILSVIFANFAYESTHSSQPKSSRVGDFIKLQKKINKQ